MNPDQIQIELRARTPMEAIDLGFAMARRWRWPVLKAWLTFVVPIWLVLLGLFHAQPAGALILIWWLKPMWDRVVLFVLSRAVFNATPTLSTVLRAKLWRYDVLGALLLRRASAARAPHMPVRMLEDATGAAANKRRTRLARQWGNAALGLSFACVMLEIVVAVGVWGMIDMLTPSAQHWLPVPVEGAGPLEKMAHAPWMAVAAYLIAVSVIEPLYVAGGFGLYLNARAHLEGWDVDLAFTRLARRLSSVASILVITLLLAAPTAHADAPSPPKDPQATAEAVLARPEFGEHKTVTRFKPRFDTAPEAPNPQYLGLVRFIAVGLRVLIWALFIALIAYLFYRFVQTKGWPLRAPAHPREPLPPPTQGEQRIRDPLPDDILDTARQRWQQGDPAGAMGLLYRAALQHLATVDQLPIDDSHTEGECLDVVDGLIQGPRAAFFRRLTMTWMRVAYAHTMPDRAQFDGFCQHWTQHFGGAP